MNRLGFFISLLAFPLTSVAQLASLQCSMITDSQNSESKIEVEFVKNMVISEKDGYLNGLIQSALSNDLDSPVSHLITSLDNEILFDMILEKCRENFSEQLSDKVLSLVMFELVEELNHKRVEAGK